MRGFKITGGKGFHIGFENGYTVSVQFGPGNYCDNYDRRIGSGERGEDFACGEEGSHTAECAVWMEDGKLINLPFQEEDCSTTVSNRSNPAFVLKLLNWAESQPKP